MNLKVTCEMCLNEYKAAHILHQRAFPLKGVGAEEVYLRCPHCNAETHCYYSTPELVRYQRIVKQRLMTYQHHGTEATEQAWRKAVADCQRVFDAVNRSPVDAVVIDDAKH